MAVVAAGGALRAVVGGGLRAGIARQPGGLQICEALVLSGLGAYWGHRAAHTVPFLWRFHKVHHSIQEMDWLAAGRLHPVDQAFTRSCAVLPLYAFGFTRATFGAFLVFTTFQALFIHANVRLRFGPLRWLLATPEFHHWHHANEPEAYNSNFAGEFPWIDWLFGTLRLPAGRMPARYGIDDPVPAGYLRQLAWPFRRRPGGPPSGDTESRSELAGESPHTGEGSAAGAGGSGRVAPARRRAWPARFAQPPGR